MPLATLSPQAGRRQSELRRLHIAEELAHLGFQALGFQRQLHRRGPSRRRRLLRASAVTPDTRLIDSAPTRASAEARLTPCVIEATAAFC